MLEQDFPSLQELGERIMILGPSNSGKSTLTHQIGTKTKTTTPLYVSLKEDDPHDITEARARELYAIKLQAEAEKNIADFGTMKVLNGRFGPYVTDGKKNAKVPKDTDPKSLSEADAKKLLAEAPARKGRGRKTTAKTGVKTTTRKTRIAKK